MKDAISTAGKNIGRLATRLLQETKLRAFSLYKFLREKKLGQNQEKHACRTIGAL
jgi:hypothetical protein